MAEDSDSGEKTEEPTSTRLGQAREQGDVVHSRDLASFIVFSGLALFIYFAARSFAKDMAHLFHSYLNFKFHHINSTQELVQIGVKAVYELLSVLGPLFAVVILFGIGASVSQFGFLLSTEKIQLHFEKLNPLPGFKRLISKETFVELFKSALKLIVLSWIFYSILKNEFENLIQLGTLSVPEIFTYMFQLMGQLFLGALIFMAVLGIADYSYQRWAYMKKMRMSAFEVREEMKQREGDPKIKSRVRQMQRERAMARMMNEVPKADVVVTNPTHVAVALQYKRGLMRAPIVIAKGAGVIAQRIKEIAAQNGVPILERKELARHLYRHCELNDAIPEGLYTAVAEVLAYVYRIKKKFKERYMGTEARV